MNNYKLTYLVSKISKNGINQVNHINQMRKIIEEKGGTMLNKEGGGDSSLLHQDLAYPIKRNSSADIATIEFSIDPTKIKEIVEKIRLDKNILRHILIKQITSIRKKVRREKKEIRTESKEADPIKKSQDSKPKQKMANVVILTDNMGEPKKEKIKKEKVKLEDIGEKLDEML